VRRVALLAALAALAGPSPAAGSPPGVVTIAAASSLRPALEELLPAFRAHHPGAQPKATFAASGALYAHIRNGAPFDLFLSAEDRMPRRLAEDGQADGRPFTYAFGRLALWVPLGSPLAREPLGPEALRAPAARRIAIANPAVAPHGAAAEAALRSLGLLDAVRERLVLGQSAQQAAQFAQSGNAQAALLPLALALAPPLATEGRHVAIPSDAHPPIEQAGAVLRGPGDRAMARALAAFLLGPEGRAVLERHGYALPAPR
jgi:molybdate transport system substrate-binding protein